MADTTGYPDHGDVFGGSWWTVGNGAQVRLESDGERRWIEPRPSDLLAMLRAIGVEVVAGAELDELRDAVAREVQNAIATMKGLRAERDLYARALRDLRRVAESHGSSLELWEAIAHEGRAKRDGVWSPDVWSAISHLTMNPPRGERCVE
jgi:hypothetical protein